MDYALHLPTPLILCAIAIDAIVGDPESLPHPVRLIGWTITHGETLLWSGCARRDYLGGSILSLGVIGAAAALTWGLVRLASCVGITSAATAAVTIAWTTIAIRGLDSAAAGVA